MLRRPSGGQPRVQAGDQTGSVHSMSGIQDTLCNIPVELRKSETSGGDQAKDSHGKATMPGDPGKSPIYQIIQLWLMGITSRDVSATAENLPAVHLLSHTSVLVPSCFCSSCKRVRSDCCDYPITPSRLTPNGRSGGAQRRARRSVTHNSLHLKAAFSHAGV